MVASSMSKMRTAIVITAIIIIIATLAERTMINDRPRMGPETGMPTLQLTVAPTDTPTKPTVPVTPVENPTFTPTSTATDTPTPTQTPTIIPSVTAILLPAKTPTETPSPTTTSTITLGPITPIPPYPPLPALNICSQEYQNITEPKDLTVVESGRRWLTVKGIANWPGDFGEYQIAIYRPNGTRQPIYQLNQPVINGILWEWNFESTTLSYGEGWYMIRLLIVKTDGNFIDIGQHDGCHIRVYLPPPS